MNHLRRARTPIQRVQRFHFKYPGARRLAARLLPEIVTALRSCERDARREAVRTVINAACEHFITPARRDAAIDALLPLERVPVDTRQSRARRHR